MILLTNCKGETRAVEEGVPYRPLDECEKVNKLSNTGAQELALQKELQGHMMLGDVIAGVIKSTKLDKMIGKTNCSACDRRRLILNMAGKLGVRETARQLIETFKSED